MWDQLRRHVNMNRTSYAVLIAAGLVLGGCGGRAANPVLIQQYADDRKSCETLELELSQIEGEIQRLMPKTDKTGKNVVLGVTGVFLIVPLFFMDLTQAEQIEVEAYRQRYNHLVIIATEKQCSRREAINPFDQLQQEEATEEAIEEESEEEGADES